MAEIGYDTFFQLTERPFSLTPDPRYLFRGQTHGRALDSLAFGLRRRDAFLLVTGDLGVGKTTLCRTLLQQLRPHGKVMYAASPLASGSDFERNVLDAFAIRSADEMPDRSVVIVDEAHTTPQAVIEVLRKLSATVSARGRSLSVIFAAQPSENNLSTKSIQAVDHLMATRSRLLPFGREECAGYVGHRLAVGGGTGISFSPSAIDVLFALSGGVPRLVNLLCERALREAAAAQCWRIEPALVEMAATSLELLRAQPRRFRWFARPGRVGAVAQAGRAG